MLQWLPSLAPTSILQAIKCWRWEWSGNEASGNNPGSRQLWRQWLWVVYFGIETNGDETGQMFNNNL